MGEVKLYYMRDNHTFCPLPVDVDRAMAILCNEYKNGWPYGMLCSYHGRPATSPLILDRDAHGGASFDEFAPRARRWLLAELAYRSPGDLEVESWTAQGQTQGEQHREALRLAKDAERYRWLRDRAPWTLISSNGLTRLAARLPVQITANADDANELDAAIDAAINGGQSDICGFGLAIQVNRSPVRQI